MKIKPLVLVSCVAAGALIASPAVGKPAKKVSKQKRTAAKTTQVTPGNRHHQAARSRMSAPRYYGATRYTGTRSYAGRQFSGTGYYGGTQYYGANTYYGGTGYYYGGGSAYPYYNNYSGWPSGGYYPYSYWGGGYPYSGYNNYYSYYTPTYGYNASLVAAVQRRLGQLGYYRGVVDGVVGPRTRAAIAAFESRNGLAVDGRISRPLLDTLGLG